jgi:hypothetical protein
MSRHAIHIKSSVDKRRHIYVDSENSKPILEFIKQDERHTRKFNHICEIILLKLRNNELYNKEDINEKCKNVTAMKFFKGQENDRIYCKEFSKGENNFIVVCGILHEKKKTRKNTLKEINLIETVASYDYDF